MGCGQIQRIRAQHIDAWAKQTTRFKEEKEKLETQLTKIQEQIAAMDAKRTKDEAEFERIQAICIETGQKAIAAAPAEAAAEPPPPAETNAQITSRMCMASLAVFEADSEFTGQMEFVKKVLRTVTDSVAIYEPVPVQEPSGIDKEFFVPQAWLETRLQKKQYRSPL